MLSQQTQRKNSTSSAANNEEGDRRTERENKDSYTCLGYFLDPSALSILRLLDDLWSLVPIASATVHFNSACSLMGWLHFHRCYHHTLTVIIICLNCAVTILCCQPVLLYQNVQCWWIVQMPEIKPGNFFLKMFLNWALLCREWLFPRTDEGKHDGKNECPTKWQIRI